MSYNGVTGVIANLQMGKPFNGNLTEYTMDVGGTTVKGFGDFPEELRKEGTNVKLSSRTVKGRDWLDVKANNYGAAPSGGYQSKPKNTGNSGAKSDYATEAALRKTYWDDKEKRDILKSEEIHRHGSINTAIEMMSAAIEASNQHNAVDGKPGMSKASLKLYSDPSSVADAVFVLAGRISKEIKSGDFDNTPDIEDTKN